MEEMIKNEGLGEVIDTVKGLIAKTDVKIQQVRKNDRVGLSPLKSRPASQTLSEM